MSGFVPGSFALFLEVVGADGGVRGTFKDVGAGGVRSGSAARRFRGLVTFALAGGTVVGRSANWLIACDFLRGRTGGEEIRATQGPRGGLAVAGLFASFFGFRVGRAIR